jgi:hypothetical protein
VKRQTVPDPHPYEPGRRFEEGALLCRHCARTFSEGEHGEQLRTSFFNPATPTDGGETS